MRWLIAVIAAGLAAGLAWARLHQSRHDRSAAELEHRSGHARTGYPYRPGLG